MTTASLHSILLLSDSALPLGSFAFSSGLESYLAHSKQLHQHQQQGTRPTGTYKANEEDVLLFISHSLANLASTTCPFIVAAYRDPSLLSELDDVLDASTACVVARRASIAQGRALVTVWERALRQAALHDCSFEFSQANLNDGPTDQDHRRKAIAALDEFASSLKHNSSLKSLIPSHGSLMSVGLPSAHLPPLFGAVSLALDIALHDMLYIYLLNHAKALLSAAVRAGTMGPYQSQNILSSTRLRVWIEDIIISETAKTDSHLSTLTVAGRQHTDVTDDQYNSNLGVGQAGVAVPAMDLWMGRHELLYSRIFNS